MTATASTPTSTDHFASALSEMREHYRTGTIAVFDMTGSVHVQALRSMSPMLGDDAPGDDVSVQLAAIQTESKTESQASVATQQQGATDASNQAQAQGKADPNGAAAAFRAKMEAQKAAAKTASDATIDKAYAAAEALGAAHPSSQDAILSGMNTITSVLNNIIGGIVNALSSIVNAIVNIISGLLKPLEAIASAFAPVLALL